MPGAANERLLKAAADGDLEGVKDAIGQGADVNARAEFGDTALNVAAQHGRGEIAQRLIEHGANLENRGGADMTPLMNAAVAGHIGVVRMLLERGALVTDDLLRSVELKVGILEENAEAGMVRPEGAHAWRQFLEFLVAARARA